VTAQAAGCPLGFTTRDLRLRHVLKQSTSQQTVHRRRKGVMVGGGTDCWRSWRARPARAYMGSGGVAPSGVQGWSPWSGGQGDEVPLKLTAFLQINGNFFHFRARIYDFVVVNAVTAPVPNAEGGQSILISFKKCTLLLNIFRHYN